MRVKKDNALVTLKEEVWFELKEKLSNNFNGHTVYFWR